MINEVIVEIRMIETRDKDEYEYITRVYKNMIKMNRYMISV